MVVTQVIPSGMRYQADLISNLKGLHDLGIKKKALTAQTELLEEVTELINTLKAEADSMLLAIEKANKHHHAREIASAFCDTVKPYFDTIRAASDRLEQIIDDRYWALPKYRELLFIK